MATRGFRSASGAPAGDPGRALRQLGDRVHAQHRASLRVLGAALVRQIKLTLSLPGTGRLYKRGRKFHRASAPGHPPAVDRGLLRNSIGMADTPTGVRVGTGVEYAPPLELEMDRRFMSVALSAITRWWRRQLVTDLRQASRKGTR